MHASILAVSLVVSPSQDPAPAPPDDAPEVVQLFHALCASCHGETGDGKGWTELDRPARSFRDGGFSFGNTPEAIYRTITHGIPGTPMPAHEGAATEDQRRALAEYVISLGPPEGFPAPTNTELVITDRPRVVYGGLPPIADGRDPVPRGLLLGSVEGLCFEYRVDDVRLLGIRQGAFCDRTDWVGRGGTRLRPLGQVVHLHPGADQEPAFARVHDDERLEPLRARLRASWVREGRAGITYALIDAEGRELAELDEALRPIACKAGAGFIRRLELRAREPELRLAARTLLTVEPSRRDRVSVTQSGSPMGPDWSVASGRGSILAERLDDGYRVVVNPDPAHAELVPLGGRSTIVLRAPDGEPKRFEQAWLRVPAWDFELLIELTDHLHAEATR